MCQVSLSGASLLGVPWAARVCGLACDVTLRKLSHCGLGCSPVPSPAPPSAPLGGWVSPLLELCRSPCVSRPGLGSLCSPCSPSRSWGSGQSLPSALLARRSRRGHPAFPSKRVCLWPRASVVLSQGFRLSAASLTVLTSRLLHPLAHRWQSFPIAGLVARHPRCIRL